MVNMSTLADSPGLGTLSTLPLEIRERIYDLVVNLNEPAKSVTINTDLHQPPFDPFSHHPNCSCPCSRPTSKTKTTPKLDILLLSKTIHNEARIVLFRVNEWKIEVEKDSDGSFIKSEPNTSIMGKPGWMMQFSHASASPKNSFTRLQTAALDRNDMWAELRFVHISVGAGQGIRGGGIRERDIIPWKYQILPGPERPSFVPLLTVIGNVCELLEHCTKLHHLQITLRGVEKTPGNIEKVLHPLRKLRDVKEAQVSVMGMQDDMWVYWKLKSSYVRYLNKILGMPRGAKAPKYVGDEEEPNQSPKDIFDIVGARWCGGDTFVFPDSDDEEGVGQYEIDDGGFFDEDDDDGFGMDDDEMAGFGEFLDYMGFPPPMFGMAPGIFGGFGMGPPPWDDSEDDDEDDEDEESDEEDLDGNDYDDDEDEDEDEEDDDTDDDMPGLTSFALSPAQILALTEGGMEADDTDDDMPGLISESILARPETSRTSDSERTWQDTDDDNPEVESTIPAGGSGLEDECDTDEEMPALIDLNPKNGQDEPDGYQQMMHEEVD